MVPSIERGIRKLMLFFELSLCMDDVIINKHLGSCMDLTGVILSHSFHQDVDVDFEPLLLALAGLRAFLPVFYRHLLLHKVLFGNFLLIIAVKVVDHLVVQQPHGGELMEAREFHRFGEGCVDVGEGM